MWCELIYYIIMDDVGILLVRDDKSALFPHVHRQKLGKAKEGSSKQEESSHQFFLSHM